jgi:hypothetical protein
VNANESVEYACGFDDTGEIPHSVMSYGCVTPGYCICMGMASSGCTIGTCAGSTSCERYGMRASVHQLRLVFSSDDAVPGCGLRTARDAERPSAGERPGPDGRWRRAGASRRAVTAAVLNVTVTQPDAFAT